MNRRMQVVRAAVLLALPGCTPSLLSVPATVVEQGNATRDADQAMVVTIDESQRDPALRTGTLPNGMRYYIRPNQMPAGRAFLWLAVKAGSLHEDDDQRGFAHFLEHMAFNGTRRFPRNELVQFVEGAGMQFGPDLNAHTSFGETVYKLTVPTDDSTIVDRGLQTLEDWAAAGITLDSMEVVAERGVVMGEWRMRELRDSVSERLHRHQRDILFGGSRFAERMPIGVPELIQGANPEPLRRFYRDWYRPDLMAVIAVGDFDADAMERRIRASFGAIPRAAPSRALPDLQPPGAKEPVVDVVRDKVSPRLHVLWPAPPEPPTAAARVEHEIVTDLLLQYVGHALERIQKRSSRPVVRATLTRGQIVRETPLLVLDIVTWPDSLERALGTVLVELQRVVEHGMPPAALEQAKAALLRRLEGRAAGEVARSSASIVNGYMGHFLSGRGHLLSPTQELETARRLLPAITPERIAAAARFWQRREGLKVLVQVPMFALGFQPPTRESVLALWDSIPRKVPSQHEETVSAIAPLMQSPPSSGRIVEERRHAEAGITEWTLSNGARVLFKPTGNDPDELLIRAWSPGGFSLVPDSLFFSSGRMVAHIMTEAAGLGAQQREALLAQLATTGVRQLRVDIGYADERIELAGSPRETELLFQLMHLQFVAPRLDSTVLSAWKNFAKFQHRPSSVDDALSRIFTGGNPRLAPVQTNLAELARVDDAMAVYRNRFANAGDFTFLIVGAATAEMVRPLVERYVASLPATDVREEPMPPEVRPVVGARYAEHESLPFPRSETTLIFHGDMPDDGPRYLRERQRLAALGLVLQRRLRDRLREEMGGTYGVSVQSLTQRIFGEHFRLVLSFQAAPEETRQMNREMLRVLDALRAHGASDSELAVVARIQRRRLETALQNNRYWLEQMQLFNRLGISMDRIVTPFAQEQLTAEEFREAAVTYLPRTAVLHTISLPKDTTRAK